MFSIVNDFLDGLCSGDVAKAECICYEEKLKSKIEQLNNSIGAMQVCINRKALLGEDTTWLKAKQENTIEVVMRLIDLKYYVACFNIAFNVWGVNVNDSGLRCALESNIEHINNWSAK